MPAFSIDDVLVELRTRDPGVAGDAGAALNAVTGGDGPEVITQARVQRFCWYTLPVKFLVDPGDHHRIVARAAEAFDLLGLDRYAEICRSEVTAKVIDGFAVSMAAGRRAYRAAEVASGLHPPATDRFEFGASMGAVEAEAATGTTALALLATNDRVDRNLLTETATAIVAEEGWHSSDTGAPPDERTIVTSWHTTTNLARALGLTSAGDDPYGTSELALSPGGQRAAIDALRHVVTGPRDRP